MLSDLSCDIGVAILAHHFMQEADGVTDFVADGRLAAGGIEFDLLGAAERIVHCPALAPEILDYARRDAEFVCAESPAEIQPAPSGLTVYIQITNAPGGTP